MVGSSVSLSPRESLSSISRVQTVVSIAGQNSLTILDDSLSVSGRGQQPVTANFNKLQHELELLQAKLNDVSSQARLSSEIFEVCLFSRWRDLGLLTRQQTNNCCLSSTNFLLSCQGLPRRHNTRQTRHLKLNKRNRRPWPPQLAREYPPPSGDRKLSGSRRETR